MLSRFSCHIRKNLELNFFPFQTLTEFSSGVSISVKRLYRHLIVITPVDLLRYILPRTQLQHTLRSYLRSDESKHVVISLSHAAAVIDMSDIQPPFSY